MKTVRRAHRRLESRLAAPGYVSLRLPRMHDEVVYLAAADVMRQLLALEDEFSPRFGAPLFFEDEAATILTPFAGRLFERGLVEVRRCEADGATREIVGFDPVIAGRLDEALRRLPNDIPGQDDVVISEADLPEQGRLAAIPEGITGPHGLGAVFGLRESDDPVLVLENILYGKTAKDDPESSHYAEHLISDGVDRD